jgi:hypothetical protein
LTRRGKGCALKMPKAYVYSGALTARAMLLRGSGMFSTVRQWTDDKDPPIKGR